MTTDQHSLFEVAFKSFKAYLAARDSFLDAMTALGLPTRNVDPLACIAEVIAARELGGSIVPKAAHPDYDVVLADGKRVQVKSLRTLPVTPKPTEELGRSALAKAKKNRTRFWMLT